jgi:hypothetical protein
LQKQFPECCEIKKTKRLADAVGLAFQQGVFFTVFLSADIQTAVEGSEIVGGKIIVCFINNPLSVNNKFVFVGTGGQFNAQGITLLSGIIKHLRLFRLPVIE